MGPNVPAINGKAVDVNHHKLAGFKLLVTHEPCICICLKEEKAVIHTSVDTTLDFPVPLRTPLWNHCCRPFFPFGGVLLFEVGIQAVARHSSFGGEDVFRDQVQGWYHKGATQIFRNCGP